MGKERGADVSVEKREGRRGKGMEWERVRGEGKCEEGGSRER